MKRLLRRIDLLLYRVEAIFGPPIVTIPLAGLLVASIFTLYAVIAYLW